MPELGNYGSAFKEAFLTLQEMTALQRGNASIGDTYDDAIRAAKILISMADENGEAGRDFAAVMTPIIDPEVERERAAILQLRENKYYGTVVTEEKIQARLAQLPEAEQYSDDDKFFATAYFVGHFLTSASFWTAGYRVEQVDVPQANEPVAGIADVEQTTEEEDPTEPEIEPKVILHIKMYGDHFLKINDSHTIDLRRQMDQSSKSEEEEEADELARVQAIELIVSQPDRVFVASEILEQIMPDTPHDGRKFYPVAGDFIMQDLQYDGENIINHWKPTETAKRRYFQLNPKFDVTVERVDEESGELRLNSFALPDGTMLFGKTAAIANLLMHHSADNLLTESELAKYELYTADEVAALKGDHYPLSGLVSTLRGKLRITNTQAWFTIHKVDANGINPATHRPITGYWMERHAEPKVTQGSETVSDTAEVAITSETVSATLLTFACLANEIVKRAAELEKTSLPIPTTSFLDRFSHVDIDGVQTEHAAEAARILQKFLDGGSYVDELMDSLHDDDPAWDVLDYLSEIKPDQVEPFKRVMQVPAATETKPAEFYSNEQISKEVAKVVGDIMPIIIENHLDRDRPNWVSVERVFPLFAAAIGEQPIHLNTYRTNVNEIVWQYIVKAHPDIAGNLQDEFSVKFIRGAISQHVREFKRNS